MECKPYVEVSTDADVLCLVPITDHQNDSVEFIISDTSYFEELENQSEIFS